HVMNITDVGHLTSDADTGEDKLEKGAAQEHKTVWEVAEFYTKNFKEDLAKLNIEEPDVWLKATDTIPEQIALIKELEKKGFTYTIADGVYFDTSKLKKYGQLWGTNKMDIKAGARVEMVEGKKHPTDFALWKLSPNPPAGGQKRQMEWEAPWGIGFPGWHTECVVMSIKELGLPFDIHCGGIDHIQIHHTNEIAQAEAAYDKNLANYWLHGEFLNLKDAKMSKSSGEIITLATVMEKGFNPLSYRYLCLTAHYRAKLTFSWESLKAAQNALEKLQQKTEEMKSRGKEKINEKYQEGFLKFIDDDLNIPNALALTWKMLDDNKLSDAEKYFLFLEFDKIFGLGLDKVSKEAVPAEILKLAQEREKYRKSKDWAKSDEIRKKIENKGWQIEDTPNGPIIRR
ncbi:MAG: class I tRNA ligase family protein, partial [Candidatus Pacebacteria bacterium]|nr:class I tRNA ligase family protein [Candidatus Paceibacterota bacterium]